MKKIKLVLILAMALCLAACNSDKKDDSDSKETTSKKVVSSTVDDKSAKSDSGAKSDSSSVSEDLSTISGIVKAADTLCADPEFMDIIGSSTTFTIKNEDGKLTFTANNDKLQKEWETLSAVKSPVTLKSDAAKKSQDEIKGSVDASGMIKWEATKSGSFLTEQKSFLTQIAK